MSPAAAALVAGTLLVLAALAGMALRAREGRRREGVVPRFDPADAGPAELGARATLVQFSSEMCTRCPQVRRMLRAIAADAEGLAHIDVDLTNRPDLSARYRVLQTPTTLLVDDAGVVHARFAGVPQRHALTEAIAAV